jgi:hypothetical protein
MTWPRDRTRGTTVGSQRLTAWAMARPYVSTYASGLFDKGSSCGFIVRHYHPFPRRDSPDFTPLGGKSVLCTHVYSEACQCEMSDVTQQIAYLEFRVKHWRTATEPTNREETLGRMRISSGLLGWQFLLKMVQIPVDCHRHAARKHSFVLVTKFIVVQLIMLSDTETITLHRGIDNVSLYFVNQQAPFLIAITTEGI